MFDLQLTNTGDIVFDEDIFPHECVVQFRLCNGVGQRVQFLCRPYKKQPKKPAGQRVSFQFGEEDHFSMTTSSIEDINEAIQFVKTQLRTEYGDVTDNAIGTNFYTFKHNVIKKEEDLTEIQTRATEIILEILPEATVDVQFKTGKGYFYCQNIEVTITMPDNYTASFIL